MGRIAPAAILILLLTSLTALSQDVGEKVDKILDHVEDNKGATIEKDIASLVGLGRAAVEDVRKSLKRPDAFARIAAGVFLYSFEERDTGMEALSKVVAGKNLTPKRVAANYIASLVGADSSLSAKERRKIADNLSSSARKVTDEMTRIHLWRSVWLLTETIQPKRALRDMLLRSNDKDVQREAALSLAEMDSFLGNSRELRELSKTPGERGRLARAFLKIKRLQDDLNRELLKGAGNESKRDYSLLDEIIDKLHTFYHNEDKIDDAKLIEAAARGICSSLDPYTSYYDAAMIKRLREEDLGGQYGGIGARVSMRRDKQNNRWLTITEPIFSGPAYKAGLRSGDQITEVEGKSTVNKELIDLVKMLRGKPDSKVKFKVYRRGWEKARDFEIVRGQVQLETTEARMLPGKIGFIRLVTFGSQDRQLVKDAIEKFEEEGMKALIFDLRGNSGGYLLTAEKLADYFLPEGKLIVSTRARGKERERRVSKSKAITEAPVVMLVNGESASASEILAGALKVHGRALVIGERTFGKGSVQDLKYLKVTDENTAVRVTIAKWYLPNGQSVQSDEEDVPGGVDPELKVELPERDFWKDAEYEKIRAGDEIATYLNERFKNNKDLFKKLAESDDLDWKQYPDFELLYKELNSKASKNEVRELLREEVRSRVADAQGRPLYFDFQTDFVLQRAIKEAAKKAGLDLSKIKEYGTFAKSK